jgi:16S rRNA (uracil1498-N3)-methyltransferase
VERVDREEVAAFFSAEPMTAGGLLTLGADAAHHIRVLRLGLGVTVGIRDGVGRVASGVLVRASRQQAVVEVATVGEMPSQPPVHALVPVADRERMLWLAEKCCELGLASWRPVLWRRSRSVSPRGEGNGFQAKVRSRMVSALLQSRGAWLPELHPDATAERALAAAPAGERLLLDPSGSALLSRSISAPVTLAIGPEGGMEPDERTRFLDAGWRAVSLGANMLRFETAGVAALAVIRASLDAESIRLVSAGGRPPSQEDPHVE